MAYFATESTLSNKAPIGAIVRLHVDLVRQVHEGDVIETRTGRGYRVLAVRVQTRGKHAGRQHVQCAVLGEDWAHDAQEMAKTAPDAWVHRICWYRRLARRRAPPGPVRASE